MTTWDQVKDDPRFVRIHDHGFVGLIDTMGSDEDICRAARLSYGAGTKSVSDDRALIRYLIRHKHTSPCEMAEVKFHLKLPIFVMRQLVRHRTSSTNEYSARYSVLSDEFYLPSSEYLQPQSQTNKQGRTGELSDTDKQYILQDMANAYDYCTRMYNWMLGTEKGIEYSDDYPGLSRELARIVMPVANYTEVYWKCDLHNFFHFCKLRRDSHAQLEIQDFANAMYNLVVPKFPLACEAFEDYSMQAVTLSRMDQAAIRDVIAGKFVDDNEFYGMSKREFREFKDRWYN